MEKCQTEDRKNNNELKIISVISDKTIANGVDWNAFHNIVFHDKLLPIGK